MFLILIILCNPVIIYTEEIPCNQQSIDKLDEYAMRLALVGDPSEKYPANNRQMLDYCQ